MNGILFKPPMIEAIVAGRKTHTRRVEKGFEKINENPDGWFSPFLTKDGSWCFSGHNEFGLPIVKYVLPRYKVGEILYIKEAWVPTFHGYDCLYKLDGESSLFPVDKWRSPLFMPECASRYKIKILSVEPKRLQDMTLNDLRAEGLPKHNFGIDHTFTLEKYVLLEDFKIAWDSIYPKHPWASNPWVPDYKFELLREKL